MSESTIWIIFELSFAAIVAGAAASATCGFNYLVVVTYQRISEASQFDRIRVKIFNDNSSWWLTAFLALSSTYIGSQLNRTIYQSDTIADAVLLAAVINFLAIIIGVTIGRATLSHRTLRVKIEALYILGCFQHGWEERAANANIIVFEHDSNDHDAFLNTPPKRRKYHYPVFAHKSTHTG